MAIHLIILLVEDNDAHAEMIKCSFEQHKVSNIIKHVEDGQVALDYLQREGELLLNSYPE